MQVLFSKLLKIIICRHNFNFEFQSFSRSQLLLMLIKINFITLITESTSDGVPAAAYVRLLFQLIETFEYVVKGEYQN